MKPTPRIAMFPILLGLIFVTFNAILVYVYIGARDANPVILDEKGRPR